MALSVKSGSYTGNGSHPQTISGVGFTPKVVFISENPGGALDEYAACWKTTDMSTGASGRTANMGENGAQTSGLIDSFNSDGFSVRGQKNLASTTYYYLALGGSDVVTGTYTGNNTDNRAITGVGFRPALLLIQGGNNHTFWKNTSSGNTTDTTYYFTVLQEETDVIQSLDTDGFTIGNRATVGRKPNENTVTYYYCAIASSSSIYSGSYSGNSTDNRSITGAGFTPVGAWVKNTNNVYQARTRYAESGDLSSFMRANNSPAANGIQAFESDGIQVGTDNTVNTAYTYAIQLFGEPSTNVTVSATVLSATFSLPASTVTAVQNVTNSPSTLSATFSIPSYTVVSDGSANVSPSALTATFSLPSSTVTAIQNVSISTNALSSTFSIPTYSVSTIVSVSPSVLNVTLSIPVYSVFTPDSLVSVNPLTATFSIPAYTVSTVQNVDVSPSVLSATFSIPSPTVTTTMSVDVTPTALSATFSVPTYTPTATSGVTVSATTLTATFSVPTYTATGIENVSISASVLTGTFSIPTYAISLVQMVSSSALSATFTIPAYTVTAIQNVSLSSSVFALSFTIPTYFARGDFWQEKFSVPSTNWSDKGYNESNNWLNKY